MVIYSILGVHMFATVKIQAPLDIYNLNFQSFENAFLILFRASTGENWHYIMYGVGRPHMLKFQCSHKFDFEQYKRDGQPNSCGHMYLAIFYFVTFLLFVNKVVMNLFIAVVLNAYNETVMSKQEIINENILEHYQRVWLKFDPSGKGFIHKDLLAAFLLELNLPLGLDPEDWDGQKLPFSYMKSLELSLYNDIMEI